jgi:hypothetical protein
MTAERLNQALAQRDKALQELATVKAELAALKLAQSRANEPAPPDYPPSANPAEPPPLRYVLVDKLHERLSPLLRRLKGRR